MMRWFRRTSEEPHAEDDGETSAQQVAARVKTSEEHLNEAPLPSNATSQSTNQEVTCKAESHDDPAESADSTTLEDQVRTALRSGSEAWNRGDLDTYLDGYTDDARYVSESLARTRLLASEMAITGKEAIETLFTDVFERAKQYQAKQTTVPKGVAGLLGFSEVTVQMIGDDNAVVFGHYCLELSQAVTDTGVFTLHVVRNEQGTWQILSEHSSAAPKVQPKNTEQARTGDIEQPEPSKK
jgi:ketosteroid isomerase-like protein